MAKFDPFELVSRLRDADTDLLLTSLRKFHKEGVTGIPSIDEILGIKPETRSPERRLNEVRYEKLKRHFVPYAEQLRQQSLLTDQLLKGYVAESETAAPILQQTLRVKIHPGTPSGARFVVVNSLGRSGELHFRTGRIHGLPEGREDDIRIEFEPDRPQLEPGEQKAIQLTVSIQDGVRWPDKLEVGVDIVNGEKLLLKVWIQLEIQKSGEVL